MKNESLKHVISCSWDPPPFPCVELNVDGSVHGEICIVGFGCIIRKNNGSFIRAALGTIGKTEINYAELWAGPFDRNEIGHPIGPIEQLRSYRLSLCL